MHLWLVFRTVVSQRLYFRSGFGDSGWFREGITLELHCRQDSREDTEISSPTKTIVERSNLVHGMTQRYDFQKNSSVNVLIIKRLSREDQGIYICLRGLRSSFAQIHVLYSPSNKSPNCTSNYDSPVIYDDIRQGHINFTCTTEPGNPPVLITLTIHKSENFQNITNLSKLCGVDQNFDNISTYSCHMNESLGDTTFLCDVTQQFPSPYNEGYRGSCSFGPLHFLSNFSVTINKQDITVKEGEGVNLTCTTNVTGVEIKWIDIPVGWEYNVTGNDYFSNVWIKHVNNQMTSKTTVQCIGSYGFRSMRESVTIRIVGASAHQRIFLTPLIVTISILTFITVGVLIVRSRWRQSRSEMNDNRADSNNPQSTYTTTVMATNESVENSLDTPNGCPEYNHSIVRVSSHDENPDTRYYDIPIQSTENNLDDGGYLIPSSLSHPRPPLYQYVA
ncbi:hypothetical protein HOLleu_40410 [Holothuria leucospilota]|uniref:Immunoglobulin domain-containing protein n=1 Tax=Holothuria leucospilota TaxID=206669 RepID=A0A9Q1BAH4_HOLLE|nr:hypothetical protein HOLleu_40410 [Holothuria leucospilota]